jgi:CRISPR/Cas system CSM-associated protein Csm2 small subunit
MGDWKSQMSKAGGTSAGPSSKCSCGKSKKPDFPTCLDCSQKAREARDSRGGSHYSGTASSATLPKDYLSGGYFESKNGKNYIREEVFMSWAKEVSVSLKQDGLTSAAIRRFFSKLRAIEYKYKMFHDFDLAREGIYAFARDVSYTENRGVTPQLFSRFIEKNIVEAKKDSEHFRAFIEHFQSVVAYFKDK